MFFDPGFKMIHQFFGMGFLIFHPGALRHHIHVHHINNLVVLLPHFHNIVPRSGWWKQITACSSTCWWRLLISLSISLAPARSFPCSTVSRMLSLVSGHARTGACAPPVECFCPRPLFKLAIFRARWFAYRAVTGDWQVCSSYLSERSPTAIRCKTSSMIHWRFPADGYPSFETVPPDGINNHKMVFREFGVGVPLRPQFFFNRAGAYRAPSSVHNNCGFSHRA